MPNEPVIPTIPIVSASAPVVAPGPIAAVVVPVVASEPVTAPVTSVEAPVVAPEAPTPTILSDALDKSPLTPTVPEAAPVVAPVEAEVVTPNIKEGQSEEPAPPPVYDAFKAPEGVTLDNERVSKFTEILSDLEVKSKADHALVQEFGQKAVDFHISEVNKAVENLTDLYKKTWDRQKTEWKDSFLKDPEIGGNRFQTTVDSALTFIRTHGGTPEQQTEFRDLMEKSGLGNHPAMIRLLANAGRTMGEGKPLAASRPAPAPKSKVEALYGRGSKS